MKFCVSTYYRTIAKDITLIIKPFYKEVGRVDNVVKEEFFGGWGLLYSFLFMCTWKKKHRLDGQ